VYWIGPALSLVAAIICFVYRRVSGRVLFVALAFALEGLLRLGMRVALLLEIQGTLEVEDYLTLTTGSSVLHVFISVLLVVGLAATFADVQRRLRPGRPPQRFRSQPHGSSYPDDDDLTEWNNERPDRGEFKQ
jgi:hypothetical protein